MKKTYNVDAAYNNMRIDRWVAPMAVIEFVDRDVEAKRVDRKKKDITKDKNKEKKLATA